MGRLGRVKEVNKAGGMKKVNKGDREKLGRRDSIGERWKEKGIYLGRASDILY